MEILTLLKANIRRKKGSFISVILLTLIIAMSITTVLSIRESALEGVSYAHQLCETPDLTLMYMNYRYSEEAVEKAKNDQRVESLNILDIIAVNKAEMGGMEYSNSMMLYKARENIRLLNDDLSGILQNAPKLQKGEIYVSQGLLTDLGGKVGEKITLETIAGCYEFTVMGVFLDPLFGSAMIGWKIHYISDEDYAEIYEDVKRAETEESHGLGKIIEINMSEDCGLSNAQFRRQLNIDTGITDMGFGSMTRDMSVHYTSLFVTVVSSVLIVFAVVLLVVVVIVTVHSISVEIETEYVTFGVLKAQGFGNGRIRMLFLGQYLLAEVIGIALGIALSVPVISVASNIFVTVTAIPSVLTLPIGAIGAIMAALLLLSAVFIFLITKKVNRISPVRAISGAKREIYFDSRVNAPISQRFLSFSLALRQFTSAKRRYIGTLAIVSVLVFFMITATMLANTINSKSALESMGMMVTEISVSPKQELSDADFEKIEKEIETFAPIKQAYYTQSAYFSFEGEEMWCEVDKDPSLHPALSGRLPVYGNEIAVSPILLDEFNVKVGDEVTIGFRGEKGKYIITGTVQLMNDTGRSFIIPYEGAQKLGFEFWLWGVYSLEGSGEDEELNEKIATALNEKYGDIIEARATGSLLDDSTSGAIEAIRLIIYVFSVLFAFIVVYMVCSKAFVQEKTDIEIYRAVGFGISKLKWQFAVRFLIVSLIGSAVGGILSFFLSAKTLGVLLTSIGVTSVGTDTILSSFWVPVIIICASFLIFSYLIAGKIKRTKIRELTAE